MKNYLRIEVFDNEGDGSDLRIKDVEVVRTNGEYILAFLLSFNEKYGGVVESYHFFDVRSKVSGHCWDDSRGDFDIFSDVDDNDSEYESLYDFDYDVDSYKNIFNEIGSTLRSMRSEFIKKYLNEESQEKLIKKEIKIEGYLRVKVDDEFIDMPKDVWDSIGNIIYSYDAEYYTNVEVPFNKKDTMTENEDGNLVFVEGEYSNIPDWYNEFYEKIQS